MQHVTTFLIATALFLVVGASEAQSQDRHLEVKVEPVAYILGGAGGHVGVQTRTWTYTLEVFGLEIPESLHGQDAFEASLLGGELHAERFFGETPSGFYAGPEIGVTQLEVSHSASGRSERSVRYSIGVRAGYRWYPGFRGLYFTPVVGLGYTLNGEPIVIENETFESGPVTPWGTVGIGWSF